MNIHRLLSEVERNMPLVVLSNPSISEIVLAQCIKETYILALIKWVQFRNEH